ncbi:MAG: MBOAT family protein [Clostridia bacterium]|nr:MBOAT family protein [Clostridia bacterium]
MVFSSLEFLTLFLPATLALYFLCPVRLRNGLLLFASLLFYAWGEPLYVTVMIGSILLNYVSGRLLGFAKTPKGKKAVLAASVAANLLILGVFKYGNFVIENVNAAGGALPLLELSLPIGISFFTFQAMSYVIDVYRGKAAVQKNPFSFGLYIALFPQLIAGPIVRYSTVEAEINHRQPNFDDAAKGVRRFVTGLAKKVILANGAGAIFKALLAGGAALPVVPAWTAAISYAFQIYFDFSGYSDMAIGLGLIFGFHFQENFNYPYISQSITEFWNRWHISLSTWFREYLYIPLGGNRKGKLKQVRNILIVWLLTGLWHGAAWNFILWGVYYGLLLLIEKFALGKVLEKLPRAVRHVYAMLVVLFGWVLFAFDDFKVIPVFLGGMFGQNGLTAPGTGYFLSENVLLLVLAAAASLPVWKNLADKYRAKHENGKLLFAAELVWYLTLFLLSVASLVAGSYNPFIYFRF